MFRFNEIKHIHFEPTQRCQAACPMCDRTNNPHIKNAELSIKQFKQIINANLAKQLNSFLMCGNHGDPMIAKDTLDMYEWLRYNNKELYLHMTTNAGGRSDDWWKRLAEIFGHHGRVSFSVDGLEDTNHLYRVNVDWKRVENSMDIFTQAGGKGLWIFLIFEHNEHQVEEAERMAKLFGLEFVKKKSGRWVQSYKNKKVDKKITTKGNEIKPPANPENQNKSVNSYDKLIKSHGSFQEYLDKTKIKCKSIDSREIYISAEGLVTPCCWTAGKLYKTYEKIGENQIWSYINDIKNINALYKPLDEIIEGDFFKKIEQSWNLSSCTQGKLQVCSEKCGTGFDAFGDQWK
jgi:MoaA/NifB/PqqE/SkfB family radical SAM enzyme